MPIKNRADDIHRQIDELETVFNKKQARCFQLGYPAAIFLLVVSLSLWIFSTAALMMSRMGSLAGFLAGCMILSAMVLCLRFMYKRWDRKSIHRTRQSAQKVFDDQFPAADMEARRLAMDFLNDNFDKYSLAQVLLDRQQPTADPSFLI